MAFLFESIGSEVEKLITNFAEHTSANLIGAIPPIIAVGVTLYITIK